MSASPLPKRLTPKEDAFCLYYFALHNGAEAARRASYPIGSAKEAAYELLTKPHIQQRLADLADRNVTEAELVASIAERKRILSKIARTEIPEDKVTAEHVIRAIQEHNRMERVGASSEGELDHGWGRIARIAIEFTKKEQQVVEGEFKTLPDGSTIAPKEDSMALNSEDEESQESVRPVE